MEAASGFFVTTGKQFEDRHIQANAKLDTPFRRDLGVALGHLPLDIDSTAHRVDDAGKLNKDAVARRLDDAPAMFCDLRIGDGASVALERSQGAFFIQAHQPRIARDIPRENGREAALDTFSAQVALSATATRGALGQGTRRYADHGRGPACPPR